MRIPVLALSFLLVVSAVAHAEQQVIPDIARPILNAICMVESSGGKNTKDGDHGKAIGPYQIHVEYWYDATHDSKGKQIYPGDYQDCRNKDYAEQIVIRYWKRYCPKALAAGDNQTLAYTHHRGADNAAYYARVLKYLEAK